MRFIRSVAPAASALVLILILAACTQTASVPPSASPSAPAPSEAPSEEPAPSEVPSDEPSASPEPSEPDVVEFELPMLGRVTEDGVEVRAEPSADAPVVTGEDLTGSGETPEVVLDADDMVVVLLGPVVAEGESWYEVGAADGSDIQFGFGWVPASVLADEGAPDGFAPIYVAHGQGSGDSVSADALAGTPISVRFAAVPMPEADECEIDITVIKSDGLGVNIATQTVTDVDIFEIDATELPSLFQEEAGEVTLQVESDCSFAARMIAP